MLSDSNVTSAFKVYGERSVLSDPGRSKQESTVTLAPTLSHRPLCVTAVVFFAALEPRGRPGWALQWKDRVQSGGPVDRATLMHSTEDGRERLNECQSHEHGMPLWQDSPQSIRLTLIEAGFPETANRAGA